MLRTRPLGHDNRIVRTAAGAGAAFLAFCIIDLSAVQSHADRVKLTGSQTRLCHTLAAVVGDLNFADRTAVARRIDHLNDLPRIVRCALVRHFPAR